jgi:hypothetical protein
MTDEAILNEFVDRVFECFRPIGDSPGAMKVLANTYKPKRGVRFGGVSVCPPKNKHSVAFDIPKLIGLFDKLESCEFSNYEKTTKGISHEPHLRMMGEYKGLIIMFNGYMKPVSLDR